MYDLSDVTDALKEILHTALATSPVYGGGAPPISVKVSCQHPQEPPTDSECDLNLYLFHVSENKFLKNGFWKQSALTGRPSGGPTRQPVAFEPLCLDLRFLLSAQSKNSHVREQQVMSIAMRALHQHAGITLFTMTPDGEETRKLTVELESPSWDELSRLWQALGGPLRMTAQYRVGVALLTPELGTVAKREVDSWHLLAGPAAGVREAPKAPHLYGTSRTVSYLPPGGVPREYDPSPVTAGPGQLVTLRGEGLAGVPVYLVTPGADGSETETEVTAAWEPPPPAALDPGGGRLLLRLPEHSGCPAPGSYLLRVGRVDGPPEWRSQAVPLSVAPWLDPAGGPLVTPSGGGLYSMTAKNVPAKASVLLGTTELDRVNTAPGPGQWRMSGAKMTLKAPPGLPGGQYPIRLRAAGVEADPALWAVLP